MQRNGPRVIELDALTQSRGTSGARAACPAQLGAKVRCAGLAARAPSRMSEQCAVVPRYLVRLAAWLWPLAFSAGAELLLTNPNGTPRTGCATAPLSHLGLAEKQVGKLIDKATGKELPFQIHGGQLAVVAKMPPYAAHALEIRPERGSAKGALAVTQDAAALTVRTSLYTVALDKARGYVIRSIRDNRRKVEFKPQNCGLSLFQEGENPKHIKRWMGVPPRFDQAQAKVKCEVLESGPVMARLRLSWGTPVGRVEEILTCTDGTRTIGHECRWSYTKPAINARFHLSMWGFSSSRSEGLIYPEGERFTGLWNIGYCRPTPGYRFAYNPRRKSGFGLVTHDTPGTSYFEFFMRGTQEGWGGDFMKLELYSKCLRWQPMPGECRFTFSLLVGGTPEEAEAIAATPVAAFTLARGPVPHVARLSLPATGGPLLVGRENALTASLAGAAPDARATMLVNGDPLPGSGAWQPRLTDVGWHDLTVSVGNHRQGYRVAVARPVTIEKVWPLKLIQRIEEPARAEVVLQSHSTSAETVDLLSEVIGGIDEKRQVDRRAVTLKPRERKRILVDWNSGEREYGLAFRVTAFLNGRPIDQAEDYTSATDFAPKVGQVGIHAPNAKQEGSEHSWAQQDRERYFGIVEYYVWMPDELLDLTPDTPSWRPHTESQGAYETTLTKKFLQNYVKAAHERGVHVYAMDAGMLSLPGILDRPELVKYTPDGQPWIFNGKIYGGERRYAAGMGNPYTREFVREWGEEMARSVDMFGWDGCRWDWGFVPTVPADPLGLDEKQQDRFGAEEKRVWHNFRGEPSTKLFPEPDKTGAELLRVWRAAVAERHPRYVYGTNFNGSAATRARMPLYFKEATTQSLLLFEYLLDSSNHYPTWETWAKHLTEDTQNVRANGGQPCVGYMRGYCAGGTALRMSQYLMFAAGCHWAGGAGPRHSLDDTWKRFQFALRFAEYYYDPGFLLLPEDRRAEVSVQAHPRVFWQQFVYERQRPHGRDVTVHLLNLPKNDHIIMHHEVPSTKENIIVSLRLKPREELTRASVMLPQPRPHAESLKITKAGETVTARVPQLATAAIVLLEVTR